MIDPSALLTESTPEQKEWFRKEMERQRSWRRRLAARENRTVQSTAGRRPGGVATRGDGAS